MKKKKKKGKNLKKFRRLQCNSHATQGSDWLLQDASLTFTLFSVLRSSIHSFILGVCPLPWLA